MAAATAGSSTLPDVQLYQAFARYNQWMNQKIYAAFAGIDDAERKRDRGAFFRSIHCTLNHLLFGDRVWLGRFTGQKYPVAPIGVDVYDDVDELPTARSAMDQEILDWTAELAEPWLAAP